MFFSDTTRDVEVIDCFHFGGWDSYKYFYYKMEAEVEAEAVEAALKSTASTSLSVTQPNILQCLSHNERFLDVCHTTQYSPMSVT